MEEERDLLTLKEVAQLLGLHVNTVYTLVYRGDLKAHKLPGTRAWRISREELDNYIYPQAAEK